jgi:hypothetical protein
MAVYGQVPLDDVFKFVGKNNRHFRSGDVGGFVIGVFPAIVGIGDDGVEFRYHPPLGMPHAWALVPATSCQLRAINKMASLLLGSQSFDLDIIPPYISFMYF